MMAVQMVALMVVLTVDMTAAPKVESTAGPSVVLMAAAMAV